MAHDYPADAVLCPVCDWPKAAGITCACEDQLPEFSAKRLRSSCSACGSKLLEWGTPRDLRMRTSDGLTLNQIDEIEIMCGRRAETWWCVECGEFGVFGPTVFEREGS